MNKFTKYLFLNSAGHTYSNLSRLFIRLFVGIMFLQFGIRQIIHFDVMRNAFPPTLGMDSETSLIIMICIEVICSAMIMLGILTRLATVPPIISMILAEIYIFMNTTGMPYELQWMQPGYLPIMFLGIFFYLILSGPGKISFDYLISLHFLNYSNDDSEEEELDKA